MAPEIFGKNGSVTIILLIAAYTLGMISLILAMMLESETFGIVFYVSLLAIGPIIIAVLAVINMIGKKFEIVSVIAAVISVIAAILHIFMIIAMFAEM